MQRAFVGPGEYRCCETPTRLETVLGSCVAVVMYSPVRNLGALAHCVLPEPSGPGPDSLPAARFVSTAIPHLLGWFARRGVTPNGVELKLFGGADLMTSDWAVGARNVEACREAVEQLGLRLKAFDLGGANGRKLVFFSHTGEAQITAIGNAPPRGKIR